jgi:hypothetical protein
MTPCRVSFTADAPLSTAHLKLLLHANSVRQLTMDEKYDEVVCEYADHG